MFFHKITQEEITKAKQDGYMDLFEKLSTEYVKQHKTPAYKRFFNWLLKYLPIFDFIVAISGLVIAIIALLKQ